MDNQNATTYGNPANPLPPVIPSTTPGSGPLGSNPEEQAPVGGLIGAVEAILRQPRRILYQLKQPGSGNLVLAMLVIAVVCSAVYGVVVGTFSGGEQIWAAPVKIAGGMLISALICLPSLYIFSCLGGSQARLAEVFGMVGGLLALMTILLVGFAPVAWVFSQSTQSLTMMGALHLAFWVVATYFGLRFLRTGFGHLNMRSNSGLNVWVIIFLLVVLQMTTALRPILGKADTFFPPAKEKKFFISHWLDCLDGESAAKTRNWGKE